MTGFYSCHKTDKTFNSLYGFGGRFLKIIIRDDCMDFELYFKVHNVVSVHPSHLVKLTNLKMVSHVVVPVHRWVKI